MQFQTSIDKYNVVRNGMHRTAFGLHRYCSDRVFHMVIQPTGQLIPNTGIFNFSIEQVLLFMHNDKIYK